VREEEERGRKRERERATRESYLRNVKRAGNHELSDVFSSFGYVVPSTYSAIAIRARNTILMDQSLCVMYNALFSDWSVAETTQHCDFIDSA